MALSLIRTLREHLQGLLQVARHMQRSMARVAHAHHWQPQHDPSFTLAGDMKVERIVVVEWEFWDPYWEKT